MIKKTLSVLCVMSILLSLVCIAVSALVTDLDSSVGADHLNGEELQVWLEENFTSESGVNKGDYTFAFVGDTQYLTYCDLRDGTDNLKKTYKWLADNVDTEKLAHVFVLGDMTYRSYQNDVELSRDQSGATGDAEWLLVKEAIADQLNGVIPYSVVRGDNDDYTIDSIFGTDAYKSQFEDFYSSSSGVYMNSITNSYKLFDVNGDKYLLMTIDFNPTKSVVNWANNVISEHSDRKVIITAHSYLSAQGTPTSFREDMSSYKTWYSVDGSYLWNNLVSQHENIMMICSGHSSADDVVYTYRTGVNGNKVLQLLVNPQTLDNTKAYTGLICLMHISENGQKAEIEYYSPLLDLYSKNSFETIRFDDKIKNESGIVDLAGFSDKGQINTFVEAPSSPMPDGEILENEYSHKRVTEGLSGLGSALVEYFSYDDDYLYYAFVTDMLGIDSKLNIRFGDAQYTIDELNLRVHDECARIGFTADSTQNYRGRLISQASMSELVWDENIYLYSSTDHETALMSFEFAISREYIRHNNLPDNILSYTLDLGMIGDADEKTLHQSELSVEMQVFLAAVGVKKKYATTYNYVFFEKLPDPVPEITTNPPATNAPIGDVTEQQSKKGCSGVIDACALALVPVALITVAASKKREKERYGK